MSSALVCLMLGLPAVGFPAPQAAGVPAEMIDRLPADTATVLILDVPRIARSRIGRHFFARIEPQFGKWLPFETAIKEVEYAVVAQYAIENFAGDFCFLLKLKERSELPAHFMQLANGEPLKVGARTVYRLKDGAYFGVLDKTTAAVVLLTGNLNGDEAIARELEAVFGEKKKGPGEALRRQLANYRPESALTLVSEHRKSGLSSTLALASFGFQSFNLTGSGVVDDVRRCSGGVALDDNSALMELRIEARDAAAAGELRERLESERTSEANDWGDAIRKAVTVTRDKALVTVRARLTRKILDALPSGE